MNLLRNAGVSFLVLSLLFTSWSGVPGQKVVHAEDELLLEYDFNDEAGGEKPADLTAVEGGGTVRVQEVPDASNKSVYLDDTSEETNVILSKSFAPLQGVVAVELAFMQPVYTSSTKVMRLKGSGDAAVIIETKDGNITYRHGDDTYEPLAAVEENAWYTVKVEANTNDQVAAVYINGEKKLENAPFYENADHIDFFESFTPNSKAVGHYVDDLTISGLKMSEEEVPATREDPPSEPLAASAAGVYEAEKAQTTQGTIVDTQHTGYTGTGFVDYKPNEPGGFIEWKVNVPSDGEYTLRFRFANGAANNRPGEVRIDGEVVAEALAFPSTGEWTNWQTTSATAQLSAGEHTIRLTGTGPSGGANIDHLQLLSPADVYEAENAQAAQGTIVDTQHAGYTGTGFVDFKPNEPGGYIEWLIEVPADGIYTLEFRFGNGAANNRPGEVRVDGEAVAKALAFPSTGEWANWESAATTATLSAGEHTVRLTGTGPSGGANIDHLKVYLGEPRTEDQGFHVEEIPTVPLSEKMDEAAVRKWVEKGLILDESVLQDKPVTRVEFIALINRIFGFSGEEKFKTLPADETYWEVSSDEWYAHEVKAARQAGYVSGYGDGTLKPKEPITRQEAAVILSRVLDLQEQTQAAASFTDANRIPAWSKGFIGAVVSEGYLSPGPNGAFAPFDPFERSEIPALLDRLVENGQLKPDHAQVSASFAIDRHLVVVALDRYFPTFVPNDIWLFSAQGEFESLNPQLQPLTVKEASVGVNMLGQTVVLYEMEETLNEDAKFRVENEEDSLATDDETVIEKAKHLITWQMDHGGWSKNMDDKYDRDWDGEESRSVWMQGGQELGTIDNGATTAQIRTVAQAYRLTKNPEFKESVEKGIEFLFKLQYPSGGFAQVYPQRGEDENDAVYYSNYVTFNDNAMINVLDLFDRIVNREAPFDTDVIDEDLRAEVAQSIESALDYILKAQIEVDGQLTAWCAQHDPVTYEPRGARSYEHPSISGNESVAIVKWLLTRPEQTEEIQTAVRSALEWFDEAGVEGVQYIRKDPNGEYFVEDPNSTIWYRFYEIGTNRGIFSGRDGVIKYDVREIEEERRHGYSWAGKWPQSLLDVMKTYGQFEHRVYAKVVKTDSQDSLGQSLKKDDIQVVRDRIE